MKAATHTEIYRRFEGELGAPRLLRFLPLTTSGLRLAYKRKLPHLLLFAPTWMMGVVQAFLVHLKFSAEAGSFGRQAQQAIALSSLTDQLLAVSSLIVNYTVNVRFFAVLAIVWFGAGLIAEDRRLGAHQLYFARPLSRLDYMLGKFLVAATFGAKAMLGPALLICGTAAFSSPDWSFLTEEWDVIAGTVGYCLLWIVAMTSLVLLVSSLVDRKTHGLAAAFGVLFLTEGASNVVARITDDEGWRVLSFMSNFERIADHVFGRASTHDWSAGLSYAIVGGFVVLALGLVHRRLRRLEVVG